MKKLMVGLIALGLTASGALAAEKKNGQDYAPGQHKSAGTSAKELAPGQRAKKGSKDANDYAPGQQAHDANGKAGSGSNGSGTGTSGSR